ncbi:MAG: DUF6491 family protein [Phenylobacterium sp.]|uniref:DUF6491 family protein n=1 Tax=Phenylobacterium sp. TaxID=1871053 RepID=UPI0027221718|nr:DUF6491 family protein [Phenylobacterium sp.]MDO8902485.1 DUF6491 family protein [Phenylobacterium sp.]
MRALVLTLAVGALTVSACAPTAASGGGEVAATGGRECFFTRSVSGFSAPDNETLYLRVGVRDVYEMRMFAPCLDMDWAQKLAVVSRSGSSVCRGADATIISPGPLGEQRCLVRAVRKLTPAAVDALPAGSRP